MFRMQTKKFLKIWWRDFTPLLPFDRVTTSVPYVLKFIDCGALFSEKKLIKLGIRFEGCPYIKRLDCLLMGA